MKHFLRIKDQALDTFKTFKTKAENHWNQKIKAMIGDKGGKYMSKVFLSFMDNCGIKHLHTVRNCPQQNSVAEQANYTVRKNQ